PEDDALHPRALFRSNQRSANAHRRAKHDGERGQFFPGRFLRDDLDRGNVHARFHAGGDTAYYIANDIYKLRTDALAAAKAGGYDSVNWNLDAVRYNGGPGSFAGAAYVHARGCWLKSSSAGVAAHEFGHNYGLY